MRTKPKVGEKIRLIRRFRELCNIGTIGTSAKCRSYTYMLLEADTLFFKTKVIYSFAFQNCLLWCAETKKQTCIQEY